MYKRSSDSDLEEMDAKRMKQEMLDELFFDWADRGDRLSYSFSSDSTLSTTSEQISEETITKSVIVQVCTTPSRSSATPSTISSNLSVQSLPSTSSAFSTTSSTYSSTTNLNDSDILIEEECKSNFL